MKLKSLAVAATVALAVGSLAPVANAAIVDAPLPSDTYITFGGLEWAWASPVAADGSFGPGSAIDLSYQAQFGWHVATAAELANAPAPANFLFPGANVPAGAFDSGSGDPNSGAFFDTVLTSAGACGAAYFSGFSNCDWSNGPGNANSKPWWGQPGSDMFSETLVARAVPEASTWAMIILGFAGVAYTAHRRKRQAVALAV